MRDALLNSIAALTLPPNFLDLIIDQMGGPTMVRDLCKTGGHYCGSWDGHWPSSFKQVHDMHQSLSWVVCSGCSSFGWSSPGQSFIWSCVAFPTIQVVPGNFWPSCRQHQIKLSSSVSWNGEVKAASMKIFKLSVTVNRMFLWFLEGMMAGCLYYKNAACCSVWMPLKSPTRLRGHVSN